MTLLFIRKANIPPTRVTPAANQAGNASAAPAAKTQPAKPGRPKAAGSGITYEYYDGGGQPPSDGGWESYQKKDGTMGYRRPAGSGHDSAPQQEDEGEEVTDDEVSEVEPPSPPNATPHDPQDATDPLKNDDGSAHGTEPLDADPFGIKEEIAGQKQLGAKTLAPEQFTPDTFGIKEELAGQQQDGSKTLVPDQFAADADTRQTQILQNIAQQTGATPSIKEVRSIPLAERDSEGTGGTSKPVSRKKDGAGIPSAKDDAANHKEARRGKEFKLPEKKKKVGDEPAPNKTMAAKPGAKRDGVDPFAKTEVGQSPVQPKTIIPEDETEIDKKAVKEKAEKADSKRKPLVADSIKSAKKDQEHVLKTKDEAKQAKDLHKKKESDIKAANNKLAAKHKVLQNKLAVIKKKALVLKEKKKANPEIDVSPQIEKLKEDKAEHQSDIKRIVQKTTDNHFALKESKKKVDDAEKAHIEASKKAKATEDIAKHELPESPADKLAHKEHTEKAKKQLEIIEAHIDADPDNEDLWHLREVFAEQASIEHVPGSDDKSALNRGASFSKNKGVDKHPDEIKADKDAAAQKDADKQAKLEEKKQKLTENFAKKKAADEEKAKKKAEAEAAKKQKKDNPDEKRSKARSSRSSSAMSSYNSGGSVGSRIGALGTKGGANQAISLAADVPKGAVSAGHHLLARKKEEKKEEKPEVDPKDDPLKKDDPDQKKAVTKSMKLYIKKATGQTPNASINSSDKSPEENEEDHESSYKKRTVGVMGGDASEDTKGSGRKMNEPHKSVKKGEK